MTPSQPPLVLFARFDGRVSCFRVLFFVFDPEPNVVLFSSMTNTNKSTVVRHQHKYY